MSKQKCAMCHGMMKPRKSKVRCYAVHMIELTEYLSAFPGAESSDNFGETESNTMFLNSIPNGWSKQAYVQVFCEYINF